MALDEPKDSDQQINRDGLLFLLGEELKMWLNLGRQVELKYHPSLGSFTLALSRSGGGGGCC